jgi:hypothetical protein
VNSNNIVNIALHWFSLRIWYMLRRNYLAFRDNRIPVSHLASHSLWTCITVILVSHSISTFSDVGSCKIGNLVYLAFEFGSELELIPANTFCYFSARSIFIPRSLRECESKVISSSAEYCSKHHPPIARTLECWKRNIYQQGKQIHDEGNGARTIFLATEEDLTEVIESRKRQSSLWRFLWNLQEREL